MSRPKRLPVQVLVYVSRPAQAGREYLLLHRRPHRDAFWQGVTGALEPGESLMQAAARELWEETGFVTDRLWQLAYTYSFHVADMWRDMYAMDVEEIHEYAFVAEVPAASEAQLSVSEHDALQWCGLEQAIGLLRWPENITALRAADAWLEQRRGSVAAG